jgi:hypothetical protein
MQWAWASEVARQGSDDEDMYISHRSEQQGTRYRDPRARLDKYLADDVLLVCPRCGGCAVSTALSPEQRPREGRPLRRVVCTGCGYTDERAGSMGDWCGCRYCCARGGSRVSGAERHVDPMFGLFWWLRAECCGGQVFWACNVEHLQVLEGYIGAKLRERGQTPGYVSMLEKLPTWMKTAKNRDELLKVIGRLRETIPPAR